MDIFIFGAALRFLCTYYSCHLLVRFSCRCCHVSLLVLTLMNWLIYCIWWITSHALLLIFRHSLIPGYSKSWWSYLKWLLWMQNSAKNDDCAHSMEFYHLFCAMLKFGDRATYLFAAYIFIGACLCLFCITILFSCHSRHLTCIQYIGDFPCGSEPSWIF